MCEVMKVKQNHYFCGFEIINADEKLFESEEFLAKEEDKEHQGNLFTRCTIGNKVRLSHRA